MKVYSTNYYNTFIEVAEDTKALCGTVPPTKAKKTIARMQYELLATNPYGLTSDDLFFRIFAERNNLDASAYEQARAAFFAKGQPCFRASPLTKTYGFGIHSDEEGRVALYGMETEEYQQFLSDPSVQKVKAMKSRR